MKYLEKMKKTFGKFGDKLVEHSGIAYSVCLTSIFFMALIFWMQISHDSESLKLIRDHFDTRIELQQHKNELSEQSIFTDQTMDIMRKQGLELRKAEDVINSQNRAIGILIQRLQELNEWPLKPKPPYDPDKITRSEADFTRGGI